MFLCQMGHQSVPSGVNRVVVVKKWEFKHKIIKGESIKGVENSTLRSNHTWGLIGGAVG